MIEVHQIDMTGHPGEVEAEGYEPEYRVDVSYPDRPIAQRITLNTDEMIELLYALAPLVGALVLDPDEAEAYEQAERDTKRDDAMLTGPFGFPPANEHMKEGHS